MTSAVDWALKANYLSILSLFFLRTGQNDKRVHIFASIFFLSLSLFFVPKRWLAVISVCGLKTSKKTPAI